MEKWLIKIKLLMEDIMWKVEWVNDDGRHEESFRYKSAANMFTETLSALGYNYVCYELENLRFDKLIQYCWEHRITDTFFSESGFHIVEFEKGDFKEHKGACTIGRLDKFKMN